MSPFRCLVRFDLEALQLLLWGFFSLASSLKHDWLNHWPLEIHLLNSGDQMDAILFPPLKQGS